jgi:ribosome recycling factor
MSKWTRTRRDPGRTYDDEAVRELQKDVTRVRELVEIGLEAESDYVDLINKLEPGMTKDRRKELVKQFRDAVYEHQQRGLRHR